MERALRSNMNNCDCKSYRQARTRHPVVGADEAIQRRANLSWQLGSELPASWRQAVVVAGLGVGVEHRHKLCRNSFHNFAKQRNSGSIVRNSANTQQRAGDVVTAHYHFGHCT